MSRKVIGIKANLEFIKYMTKDVQYLPEEISQMNIDFYKNFQQNDFDLTDDRKLFDWSTKQTYLPLANMMTSAAQIGIDSCPIEGFDRVKIKEILATENVVDSK